MKKLNSRIFLSFVLLLGSAGVCAAPENVQVMDPWVREAPPFSKTLAGYLMVRNNSDHARLIVGASSPAFDGVEMHKTEIRDGVANMLRQDTVELAPNSDVVFETGGYHLMLVDPAKPLRAGDSVAISLLFADGEKVQFSADVRKAVQGMGDMKAMPGMK